MGSGVKGLVALGLEVLGSPGPQVLLAKTAIASTMSLTTAPSGTTGMRMHVTISEYVSTSGTFTITGKDTSGATLVCGPITVPPMLVGQNGMVTAYEYVTQEIFGSATVTTSAVTTTGLVGNLRITGIMAAKYMMPCDIDPDAEFNTISPNENRGTYDQDFNIEQTTRTVVLNKMDQALYPESSMWLWYAMVNATPVVTTLPSTPTVLKASTAVSGGALTLTTQPTAYGMLLIFTTTGVTAAGTIVIAGASDQYGITVGETISVPNVAAGTYYSTRVYSNVPSGAITFTGLTGGSVAVAGVFGIQYVFTPGSTEPYTFVAEYFDGTLSSTLPFCALGDATLDLGLDKEGAISTKGIAQNLLPIGDRSSTPVSTSRITPLGQSSDAPMVGTSMQIFMDPISNTPLTTLYNDLFTMKLEWKWDVIPKWTATLYQAYNRVYRKKRQTMMSATVDFNNPAQWELFRKNQRQYFGTQVVGSYLGGGYSKSVTVVAAAKILKYTRTSGPDKENVEAAVEATCEYDIALGAAYRVTIINQQPPVYNL